MVANRRFDEKAQFAADMLVFDVQDGGKYIVFIEIREGYAINPKRKELQERVIRAKFAAIGCEAEAVILEPGLKVSVEQRKEICNEQD